MGMNTDEKRATKQLHTRHAHPRAAVGKTTDAPFAGSSNPICSTFSEYLVAVSALFEIENVETYGD